MGLFGASQMLSEQQIANSNEVLEMFYVDDIMRMNSDQILEFCNSEEAKILEEKAVLKKPTMVRLSKADDMKRRTKMMAYQLAKDANDPQWNKLKKYTSLRKECISKIMTKYGPRAEKLAREAQKNYIKTAGKVKAAADNKEDTK
jgi:hypothetical protein